MILANTAITGYSLGLPLLWPESPAQLSTGLIQGISISLRAAAPDDAQRGLYIDRYSITKGCVALVISDANGPVCSLDTTTSDDYTVCPLQKESDSFIGGWVGLYPVSDDILMDLQGARINPLYVHISYSKAPELGAFTLVDNAGTGRVISAIDLMDLTVANSPDVVFNSSGSVYSATTSQVLEQARTVDSTSIYYVNGNAVDATGNYTLNLPNGWVVMGNSLCARVGNPSTVPSCVATNPIKDTLGPQNFVGSNPLAIAFDSGGELDLAPIYGGQVLFNPEYETQESGTAGLYWSSWSEYHDVIPDE